MKKITIEKNAANTKLLKLMADTRNMTEAVKAREAFAAFITQPILQVIESAPVIGNLFTTWTYDYGTPASIPLAPLFDIKQADFIKVWAQSRPGGLASSQNMDVSELMVSTYALTSAVNFPLNYVRAARTDVVAAYIQRMIQEFLYKNEANAFSVLGAVLAQSTYVPNQIGTATPQLLRSNTQGTVIPQDISRLVTLMSRVNTSYDGATPAGAGRSITTLVGSPEFMEQIRNMAFQALNTNNTNGALGGPEKFREDIYSTANPSIYGMELINVYDLGVNQKYNTIFANYAGSTTFQGYGNTTAVAFSPGSEQVIIGIDRRQDFLARLVETNPDDGSTLEILPDNQYSNRAETIGYFGKQRCGYVALDGRNCVGLVY